MWILWGNLFKLFLNFFYIFYKLYWEQFLISACNLKKGTEILQCTVLLVGEIVSSNIGRSPRHFGPYLPKQDQKWSKERYLHRRQLKNVCVKKVTFLNCFLGVFRHFVFVLYLNSATPTKMKNFRLVFYIVELYY